MTTKKRTRGLGDELRKRAKSPEPDIREVWSSSSLLDKPLKKSKRKKIFKKDKNLIPTNLIKLPRNKKKVLIAPVLFVALFLGFNIFNKEQSAVLSDSDVSMQQNNDGSTNEEPPFTPIYPNNIDSATLEKVTRKTPDGNIIISYRDTLSTSSIEVTQQKLPENFKDDRDKKLKELAEGLYATNVIQINEDKIYHGVEDETKIQTLIFIKNDKLLFIKSSPKLNDDYWVGYIENLK